MTIQTTAILFSLVTLLAAPPSWQISLEQARQRHAAGDYREAERLFRTALAELERVAPQNPQIPEVLNDVGAECHLLARYGEAEAFYQQALNQWRREPAPPTGQIARTLVNLATTERALSRYTEAEAAYQEALQSLEQEHPRDPARIASTLANQADLYRTEGKFPEALRLAQRSMSILEDLGEVGEQRLAFSLQTLAAIHRAAGRLEEAGKLYRRALPLTVAAGGDDHPATAAIRNNLADIDVKLGNYAEGEELARQAMTSWERSLGPAHPRVAVAAVNLAQAFRFQQKYADAEAMYARALEVLQGADRARCLVNLADMHYQRERLTKAVELYRQALAEMQQALGPQHPETALLMARLAEVRRGQGLYAESVKLYRRAIPILEAHRPSEDAELRAVRRSYDQVLKESARTMVFAK